MRTNRERRRLRVVGVAIKLVQIDSRPEPEFGRQGKPIPAPEIAYPPLGIAPGDIRFSDDVRRRITASATSKNCSDATSLPRLLQAVPPSQCRWHKHPSRLSMRPKLPTLGPFEKPPVHYGTPLGRRDGL